MFYQKLGSTDNYKKFTLGEVCNLTINNTSLANSISISSDGSSEDIAEVLPNSVLTLDQNRFGYQTIYIKSKLAGASSVFQIWAW